VASIALRHAIDDGLQRLGSAHSGAGGAVAGAGATGMGVSPVASGYRGTRGQHGDLDANPQAPGDLGGDRQGIWAGGETGPEVMDRLDGFYDQGAFDVPVSQGFRRRWWI
jgi:hypothetical protein